MKFKFILKKEKKGIMLYLAILIMMLSTVSVYFLGNFFLDKIKENGNTNLTSIAQSQSENALVYGVHVTNTKSDVANAHGRKCGSDSNWYSGQEIDITDEDGGIKEVNIPNSQNGSNQKYIVKRYIKLINAYNPTVAKNATFQGIARIYDSQMKHLIAEKAVEMNANLVYSGTNTDATSLCNALSIEMRKETWHIVK